MKSSEDVAQRLGPRGQGTSGFKVPGDGTLKKGRPADELSPKATGVGAAGGQGAATLGALTEGDRGPTSGSHMRQDYLEDAQREAGGAGGAGRETGATP